MTLHAHADITSSRQDNASWEWGPLWHVGLKFISSHKAIYGSDCLKKKVGLFYDIFTFIVFVDVHILLAPHPSPRGRHKWMAPQMNVSVGNAQQLIFPNTFLL